MVWQTCFCARMRRSAFSIPLPGCRAAVPFGQSPKRHQKRFCSPAPSENTCGIFRRRRISGRGSLVLLMQAGYGRWLFTLILVAVCTCWLEQGITAKVEPRRRNCRRAISLAAREKGGKQLLRPFVCLQKDVAAGKQKKAAVNGLADMFLRAYAAQYFQLPITRMPRRSAFWPKPQKAPKTLLFPGAKRKHLRYFSTAPN